MAGAREHYTLVCKHCGKIIMITRPQHVHRPVRYGECRICAPQQKRWNYRNVPMREPA
jgi:rRNA maturation protein Nop10